MAKTKRAPGVHTTIAMPGATSASAGFPDNREQGGAYIMAGGHDRGSSDGPLMAWSR